MTERVTSIELTYDHNSLSKRMNVSKLVSNKMYFMQYLNIHLIFEELIVTILSREDSFIIILPSSYLNFNTAVVYNNLS